MALCEVPERPAQAALLSAHSILERACDGAEAFISAFATVRKARNAKGTATDHEQDLMRAALVFAAAGLDSLVKQLVRDALQTVIAKNKGAHAQFTEYVQSRLRRTDGADLRFLAEALAADRPSRHLQQQLVAELTSSSLQSKDQLLRVAAYFAIPASEISTDVGALQQIFHARNQIAHEMDILLGQKNRGRRQRKAEEMKDYASTVLKTALAFYTAVEKRL
jgi:hypothetical protein